MAKKKSNKPKKTLTPEHLAKMKEGREKAAKRKKLEARISDMEKSIKKQPKTYTETLLDSIERKSKTKK